MASVPAHNPAVPFLGKFRHPLRVGSKVKICGTMTHGCDDIFIINLQSGAVTKPRDDTALHLSVRPKEHTIVRNHFQSNKWGVEERSTHCPIQPGSHYEIMISVGCDGFSVSVNGCHYCDFRYRLRFETVCYISVTGQTTLRNVDLH